MNHRRITAAIAFLAIVPATMAMAGTASAAPLVAAVHGCPLHAVCVYDSTAHYRQNDPTAIDASQARGVVLFAPTNNAVTVNNTTGAFSSEGNPVLHSIKGNEFCLYTPYPGDIQSPRETENPASGSVQAIDRGPTEESVETDFPLPLSDCNAS